MDKKKGIAELMPFEAFIEDYISETTRIAHQINSKKQKGKPPFKAKTTFYHLDGRVEQILVHVVEYDENLKKFFVEYEIPEGPYSPKSGSNIVKKQSGRLNLQFVDFDTEEKLKRRFINAQNRRKVAMMLLAEERIILNELIYKYQDIFMPVNLKMQIRKLVNARVSMNDYPHREICENLIMQVEALYVYSILKSVIRSQKNDLMIQKLMNKYALKSFEPPLVDHDGTMFKKYTILRFSKERREDYNNAVELINGQTVPGNKHLMDVMRFAMKRTLAII